MRAQESRKKGEKERLKRLEAEEERKAQDYNPWGRGGAGAPLRDAKGFVPASLSNDA